MSVARDKLRRGHGLAWKGLEMAFIWAELSAMESEHEALRASMHAQVHIEPTYEPIVQLLIDSVPDEQEAAS